MIDDGPHDHLAEAYEDCTIWIIPRTDFLSLMREFPALGQEVITLLGLRVRMYRTRVRETLHQSAHSRVASTLLHLVGLTRETVNFILKDLRERNRIETQGRSIRLKNPAVLQHAVR